MTSANFAAAQERVLERRRQRELEARNRLSSRTSRLPPAVSNLPYPLSNISTRGLALWDVLRGREGTRPAFRVGQVDAELLDEELITLLKGQMGEGLKYFGRHIRDDWNHEIDLVLRAILFKLSVWDHNASYGAALQNLKYTDSRSKGPVHSDPTRFQKSLYGLLTVGGRYAWDKWESWIINQGGDYDEPPSSNTRALSKLTSLISTAHSMAAFASFLIFLVNGRYRTLVDRLLCMRLTPPSMQLVWHAFTEFLLFLLPLVGIGRWRRWVSRAWRKTMSSLRATDEESREKNKGELGFLPERTCPICYQAQNPTTTSESDVMGPGAASGGIIGSAQTDITNPYETVPCRCLYCFTCIAQKLEGEDGEAWACLRCGELVKQCGPWNGDVLEETPPQPQPAAVRKNVEFAVAENHVDSDTVDTDSVAHVDIDDGMNETSPWAAVGVEETDDTSVHTELDYQK
ncbi:peroxisomal biogenesis factor 2 [Microsporum canis CBS 113480]|uniref:Peroxisomal biogenesis factor 2 n=1 Tax=Arthroderma otae (strain ATCC MYA-4605 / CBS 113480) TaxID=554155 RepID=C5FT54_ARTOC|nr:peroxisomal biogenesis factor 2 [Microsporum canis CBS 113480]EEQ33057.1 peroxisomal biogenesis factor 2 [Microsporum canis CBS 113480]